MIKKRHVGLLMSGQISGDLYTQFIMMQLGLYVWGKIA